jgi:hypothetical protein
MSGRHDEKAEPFDRSFAARGGRMAAVLAGAWRREPPALEMSEAALDDVALGLLRSKTGALAWWRVRQSPLRTSAPGERLRGAYQNHGLQTALHAASLPRVVTRLRDAGIDPVLALPKDRVVFASAVTRMRMTDRRRPMTDFGITDWGLPCLHALEEESLRRLQTDFIDL